MINFEDTIKKLPGFKITNSHFLLGSKIHISDFYFAKRMFQNSFFASKLAFLVSRYILENYKEDITEGLTLIGYGLYSELLLSHIEIFLKKALNLTDSIINHNIMNFRDELKLVKGYEEPHKKIMLIIPIASTFSTSIKIEEALLEQFPDRKILPHHLNVLLVANNGLKDGEINHDTIEYKFGWKSVNLKNRIVTMNVFQKIISKREQKYFLSLPSNWYDIIDCERCFPNTEPLEEKSLNITDRTSVTPTLVFDNPRGRLIDGISLKRKFVFSPEMLEYGHLTREDIHYHYYIYIEKFFNENRKAVEDWLRNEVKININYNESEYALIVAPGHFSNAGFVNLVNEILFSNSANILHYDPNKDNIQNFQLFYKDEVIKANKIFFVDDTISTGNTFTRANYFIKQTCEEFTSKEQTGFDGCIVLLDRSSFFVNKNILRKLQPNRMTNSQTNADQDLRDANSVNNNILFSFVNLHLPSLIVNHDECPLCKETKRYSQLMDNSFLDRLKVRFMVELKKILERDLTSNEKRRPNENYAEDKNRYLKRIEAIHGIFQWFSIKGNYLDNYKSFNEWVVNFQGSENCSFPRTFLEFSDEANFSDDKATLLKVLIQPPFSNFQPIREKLFDWVILLLSAQVNKVKKEIQVNTFSYQSFKDLKFLMRRAGLLNANYLMSEEFLGLLEILYSNSGLNSLRAQKANSLLDFFSSRGNFSVEEIEQNIRDFNVYYSAHIKELLFLNEARSIRLEERLIKIKNPSNSFQQLIRILREENSILIQQFWDFLNNNDKWVNEPIIKDFNNGKITDFLQKDFIKSHYRYTTLLAFFEASKQEEPSDNKAFLNYLWLMSFFSFDKNEKNDTKNILQDDKLNQIGNSEENHGFTKINDEKKDTLKLSTKTEYLINKLGKILFGNENTNYGAFFIVNYKEGNKFNSFLAFNRGESNSTIESFYKTDHYLTRFLEGIDDNTKHSKITIIEFYRRIKDNNSEWFNLYSQEVNEIETDLGQNIVSKNFDRLILLRINKREFNDKNEIIDISQGILGFYFHNNGFKNDQNVKITDINKTRYLLLLRSEIGEFIKRHHENNEFWEWREADTRQKTALLTGHGREMLIDIALKYPEYFQRIVSTILLTQLLSIYIQDEDTFNLPKGYVEKVFKKLFIQDDSEPKSKSKFPNITLNKDFFIKLKEMAKKIFEIDEIENMEVCEVKLNEIEKNFAFDFSPDILNMICFELFLNAKKNRWIFEDGEEFTDAVNNKYKKNTLWIDAIENLRANKLVIKISSTCPWRKVDEGITQNLTRDGRTKMTKTTAGLELVYTLLTEFKLGRPLFNTESIENNFSKFIVTLELNRWDDVAE